MNDLAYEYSYGKGGGEANQCSGGPGTTRRTATSTVYESVSVQRGTEWGFDCIDGSTAGWTGGLNLTAVLLRVLVHGTRHDVGQEGQGMEWIAHDGDCGEHAVFEYGYESAAAWRSLFS